MRKYGALIIALILTLPLCWVYLSNGADERDTERPRKSSAIERIQMRASLSGNAKTAKISMHSVQEDARARGYVNIPFSKRYLSTSVRIIATTYQPDDEIYCRIYDINNRILDSDGPGMAVDCEYSTF